MIHELVYTWIGFTMLIWNFVNAMWPPKGRAK